ncbi:MAG: copper homeostasis protein [Crocinitomicaceae bacterium]|jgi:copper homeostasis protein
MKVELCVASIEGLQIAKELNVDRIELCQNLEQGGMTPSPGFIEYALAYGLETHVLIRPRSGGFRYSDDEVEIIVRDILECKGMGVHGVVVGVLDEKNMINRSALELIKRKAGDLEVTFHRAFDDTYDHKKSIDSLIELGITRILSSGLARNVELGSPVLKSMMEHANGRIEIMPGGGVNLNNIKLLCSEVKPDAIHFSGTTKVQLDEESMFSELVLKPDSGKIRRLMEEIQ